MRPIQHQANWKPELTQLNLLLRETCSGPAADERGAGQRGLGGAGGRAEGGLLLSELQGGRRARGGGAAARALHQPGHDGAGPQHEGAERAGAEVRGGGRRSLASFEI